MLTGPFVSVNLRLLRSPGPLAVELSVAWWRHWMEHFPRYWPFVWGIHRWPVNSPHKGQWRGALMFSLICAWMNDWVNNREAGDVRRHCAHYDVIVMEYGPSIGWCITCVMGWFKCRLGIATSPGGRFKNTFELSNLIALKISTLYKNRMFCMGKIFCVEFQREYLPYTTHTLKDVHFM